MAGYYHKSVLLNGQTQTVGASATNTPVSKKFPFTGDTKLLVDFKVSAAAVTTGVNVKLQMMMPDETWVDMKTTTVANAFTGWKTQSYLIEVSGDQTYFPLRSMMQLVVSSGVSDSVTITDVSVTQHWGGI